MCAGFDAAAQSLYVLGEVRERGEERIEWEFPAASAVEIIIYFIPIQTPPSRHIVDYPPFDVSIAVSSSQREIYNTLHSINAWGGSVVKLELKS